MKKLRSTLYPFSPTKACVTDFLSNFHKSPYFSRTDFNCLLDSHVPKLLDFDIGLDSVKKMVWVFEFDVLPYNAVLEHCNGFKFEYTLTNCVYALLYRVLAAPVVEVPKSISYSLEWCIVPKFRFDFSQHEQEWLLNLKPHQRARCLFAYNQLKISSVLPRTLDVFPKCDELLLGKSKPRIIWSVPPTIQAFLGPVFRQLTLHLKKVFDGRFIFEGDQRFTIYFACGLVASELSEWFTYSVAVLESRVVDWCGVFLGDDTFVLYWDGCVKSLECDFSSFDSSQRTAAQLRLQDWYKLFGLPQVFIDACDHVSKMWLRVRYGKERKFSFKIKPPTPQTATGKPDTCIGNTLLNIDSTVHVMRGGRYSDYGFEAKLIYHAIFTDGTFLKGFWCRNLFGTFTWTCLPSQMIKLCKTFDFTNTSTLQGIFLKNLSSVGYSSTPLIRVMLKRFNIDFSKRSMRFWKVYSDCLNVLDESSLVSFCVRRYKVSFSLFVSLESLLLVTPLGSPLHHPLWARLAKRDYGDWGGPLEILLI